MPPPHDAVAHILPPHQHRHPGTLLPHLSLVLTHSPTIHPGSVFISVIPSASRALRFRSCNSLIWNSTESASRSTIMFMTPSLLPSKRAKSHRPPPSPPTTPKPSESLKPMDLLSPRSLKVPNQSYRRKCWDLYPPPLM